MIKMLVSCSPGYACLCEVSFQRDEQPTAVVPGGGEEVEGAAEDEGQLGVALGHQPHRGVAARRADRGAVAATLFPQRAQRRTLRHTTRTQVSSGKRL